jgi:hypothetical protein
VAEVPPTICPSIVPQGMNYFIFLFNCGDVEWAVKVIVAHRSDKSVSFMSMLNDAVIGIEQEPLRD